jgi:uncharacterized protein with GYD domain
MATYICTVEFSDKGVHNIKDTCQRAQNFTAAAEKLGVKVRDIFWTLGPWDGLIVMDAPDEETVTALMLQLASEGNVRTHTGRAYNAAEMQAILSRM